MFYQITHPASLPTEIRRIVREQIAVANEGLGSADDIHTGIHTARKALKQIRALLRLIRFGLEPKVYKFESDAYRDIGKKLSQIRDASSRLTALEVLKQTFGEETEKELFDLTNAYLLKKKEEATEIYLTQAQVHIQVIKDLNEAATRVEQWEIEEISFREMKRGIAVIYKKGIKAFKKAYREPTVENFHNWRKQVKYLWYHISLIELCWEIPMGALKGEVDLLAKYLGEDHDMAILEELFLDKKVLGGKKQVLIDLAQQRSEELRKSAFPLGKRIYAEPVKGFTERLEVYWNVWEEEKSGERDQGSGISQQDPLPDTSLLTPFENTQGKPDSSLLTPDS